MEDELLYTQEDMDEWKRTCDELQEHLHEDRNIVENLNKRIKDTRKEVCDEIRVKFNEYIKNSFCFNPSNVDFINLNIDEIREFLDKIEQSNGELRND